MIANRRLVCANRMGSPAAMPCVGEIHGPDALSRGHGGLDFGQAHQNLSRWTL
jgi:hypothetical protein